MVTLKNKLSRYFYIIMALAYTYFNAASAMEAPDVQEINSWFPIMDYIFTKSPDERKTILVVTDLDETLFVGADYRNRGCSLDIDDFNRIKSQTAGVIGLTKRGDSERTIRFSNKQFFMFGIRFTNIPDILVAGHDNGCIYLDQIEGDKGKSLNEYIYQLTLKRIIITEVIFVDDLMENIHSVQEHMTSTIKVKHFLANFEDNVTSMMAPDVQEIDSWRPILDHIDVKSPNERKTILVVTGLDDTLFVGEDLNNNGRFLFANLDNRSCSLYIDDFNWVKSQTAGLIGLTKRGNIERIIAYSNSQFRMFGIKFTNIPNISVSGHDNGCIYLDQIEGDKGKTLNEYICQLALKEIIISEVIFVDDRIEDIASVQKHLPSKIKVKFFLANFEDNETLRHNSLLMMCKG